MAMDENQQQENEGKNVIFVEDRKYVIEPSVYFRQISYARFYPGLLCALQRQRCIVHCIACDVSDRQK